MSDKHELQNEVNNASTRFSSLIDAAFDGIITIDENQKIQLFNHAAENIFGYSADEIIGKISQNSCRKSLGLAILIILSNLQTLMFNLETCYLES